MLFWFGTMAFGQPAAPLPPEGRGSAERASLGLSGVYTIGGASPDYASFTAALSDLTTLGVSGPVEFKVRNGTYTEQLIIPPITGADATNTISFESESGDSALVILTFSSAAPGAPWTLRLNDADYITFKKMTIEAAGAAYAQAVHLFGNAQYNRFLNNILKGPVTTSTSTSLAVVYCAVGDNRNTVFRKNRILNGSTGIYFSGNSFIIEDKPAEHLNPTFSPDVRIDSNLLLNQYAEGMYVEYVERVKIRANSISSNSTHTAYIGLTLTQALDSTEVSANRIAGLPLHGDGVRLSGLTAAAATPALIANNFIEISGALSDQGLLCANSSDVLVLHNTVRVSGENNAFGAFYLQWSTDVVLRNNIFSHSGGGYAFYKEGFGTINSDYNNLYSSGSPLGRWENTPAPDLAVWQAVSMGLDSHSYSLHPQFAGPGAYRPRAIELNGSGIPAYPVFTDLEGEPRHPMHPDIGADEFTPDSTDAAVPAFAYPQRPAAPGPTPVRVLLKNNGLNTITSAVLFLKVNAAPPVPTAWSGSLASGDTAVVVLDTIMLVSGSLYDLKAWVAMPNGMPDPNAANDTATLPGLLPALSGVYTIGGPSPDFPTFSAAVSVLTQAGVSGPVTFNARNGTYPGQITLGPVPGADSTRRVVFQSELGDSSLVVLTFSSFDIAAPWTLRLLGADYCTFRRMTIAATGPFAAQAVHLSGDAQYNVFNNNILRSSPTGNISLFLAVVFCSGGVNRNAVFRANRIENGSTGLWFEGNFNNGNYVPGVEIDSNRFVDQFARAGYLTLVDAVQVRANTLSTSSIYNAYGGFNLLDGVGAARVLANRVYPVSPNATGIAINHHVAAINAPAIVANNFVDIAGDQEANGITCYSSQAVHFLHNSVRVRNGSPTAAAFALQYSDSIRVYNNIFSNSGGGYAALRTGSSGPADYNDLYAAGTFLGNFNGAELSDLSAWRATAGVDTGFSLPVDPQFGSAGAYRPHAIQLNAAALPEPAVPLDIEGGPRDSQHPDIGADEFTPDAADAALTGFIGLTPPVAAGPTPVRARLLNNGLNTLTSVQLYLQVNNATPVLTNWSGTLASGDTATVILDTVDLTGGQTYDLVAWTALPNGAADQYAGNDTTELPDLFPALSGVYTIGGTAPDFPDFSAAAAALLQGGVSGPVTFNARAGTYTEQITLGQFLGADSAYQVVFQSESGDSTSVVLRFSANSADNFTVLLDGADWVTFRKMTIEAQNSTYGRLVEFANEALHITLANCVLKGVVTASTLDSRALIYCSGGAPNHYLRLLNNRMLDGSHGVSCFGSFNTNVAGAVIAGNRMDGQFAQGIFLYYYEDPVIENNSIRPTAYFSAFTGISLNEAYKSPRITGNKITGSSDGIGIYLANTSGTDTTPVLVANNYIRMGSGASTVDAISVNTGQYIKILYNTVSVRGTNPVSAALYLANYEPRDVYNNLLANFGSGYALKLGPSPNNSLHLDYNNLYTKGPVLVIADANYATLTDWKNTGLGFDEHSLSLDPLFYTPDSFRVAQTDLNGAGTPIPFVGTDIDGQSRDAQHPDIGADEFAPALADAGVSLLVTPVKPFAAGVQPIQAVLKNYGSAALTAVTINWTLDGVAQTPFAWTGNLAPGAAYTAGLGSVNFVLGTIMSIKAWTTQPNGVPDTIPINDTTRVDNLHPGLGGVYTIGGGAPDFDTFNEAVTALKNGGVLAAVTFKVRNGTYTEQVDLAPVFGAGAGNPITFQSEAEDTAAVTLQFSGSASLNFVLRLDGGDWFRFRRLTIKALSTTNSRVIALQNGADNNVLEYNRLIGVTTTSTSDTRAIVYSPTSSTDHNNVFRCNHFLNGSDGLLLSGSFDVNLYENNTQVENNRFENQYRRAVVLVYQNAPVISGNSISSTTTYTAYNGITTSFCAGSQRVADNRLNLDKATYGIAVDNCLGTAANPGLIANNFVQIGGTLQAEGIWLSASNYQNIYFNSVHLNSSNTASRAFALNSGSNLRLFNNIGFNSTGGYVLQRNSTTNIAASDNNDWYTAGSNLVSNSNFGTFFATLAAWQTATGFDALSLSIDPQFASATDLHTTNIQLDGKAVPFAGVPSDIDGQVRNTTAPDIGADEFASAQHDAGVLSVDFPKEIFGAGNQPVRVTIFNNGLDTLESATIGWTLNGIPQPPFNWTGLLLSGDELDSLVIGNFIFEVDTGYTIEAWTLAPNGQADGDATNDTARVDDLHAALAGIYTIGGTNPDFASFSAAVAAMEAGGVVGAVVFNVRDGTYTEQVVIGEIMGAGAANTITFQSESGDSTAAILSYGAATFAANYTLYLNGADWLRFQRLGIRATGLNYARVVEIQNGATQNIFEGNLLYSNPAASSELVRSADHNDNNNEFRGNRFQNGYYGLYLSGTFGSPPYETGTRVIDNVFEQQLQYGIYLLRQYGAVVRGNTIDLNSGAGIYIVFSSNACVVEKNRVTVQAGSGIYFDNCDNTIGNEGLVANNFIAVGNQQNNAVNGIVLNGSDRNRIYHNSVHVAGANASSRAFYNSGASNGLVLRNNIFFVAEAGVAINNLNGPNFDSDYNDLMSNDAYMGQWMGTNAAGLAAWQTLSGQDAHSLSIDPLFVSYTDLHAGEVDLDKAGEPLAAVADDIDGEPRHLQTPDIGADEFLPLRTRDIGVAQLYFPAQSTPFAAGNQPVLAVVKNNGADTITSATIRWWVNNNQQTFFSWSGFLEPGERDTVQIGTFSFPVGFGHDFRLYTENPNGQPDLNPENDTLFVPGLYAGLNGAYTIGGVLPDFTSFTQAVNSLNKGGVLGPVVFNVRSGLYSEKIALDPVRGGSGTNTVTFQSVSGDSSAVTLRSNAGDYVVLLNGADHVTFRHITLENTNAHSLSDVVELRNSAAFNTFSNNRIVSQPFAGALIRGDGYFSLDSHTVIRNNLFQDGHYGVLLAGINSASLENGIVIENNRFENQQRPVVLAYAGNPLIQKNNIEAADDALTAEYCLAPAILKNKISTGGGGISLNQCTGNVANRALVANNFVHLAGASNRAGISTYSGDNQNFYYNSVHLTNTNANSSAFYQYYGSGKYALNNIFANAGGGYATYVQYAAGLALSDFNDLYTSGTYIGYWDGTALTDLPALRTLSGKENNSVSADPLFLSAADLHILQAQLDSAATPLAEVNTDIDGTTRNANFPDIGADEINFLAQDAGVALLPAPATGCARTALEIVTARIQNYSSVTLSGFDVAYSVNGGTPVVENIGALAIPPGSNANYSFAAKADLSAVGTYTFALYTLLAGDGNPGNDTLVAQVQHVQTPPPVAAMIPADGASGLSTTIAFSWSPAAGATLYDLFIWPFADNQPAQPTIGNINQINYTFDNPGNLLAYGQPYKWRVKAKNASCSTEGPVQTFTVANLPDLLVNSLTAPPGAFSGQSMSLSWEVKNMASGNTGMGQWTDVAYLSVDAVLEYNSDIYLGGVSNFSALGAGQSYSNTAVFTLPQGLSGTYYVFVGADRFGAVLESNEANNTLISAGTVNIQLTPPPDLQVTAILPPNNPFSGLPVSVGWTVTNLGAGETRSSGWIDRVYLSADSAGLIIANATPLGQRSFSGVLDVNDTYNESLTANLPQGISGPYYIYIVTDATSQEYEHAAEGNNTTRSAVFTVFLTPPPDLQVTSVTAPAGGSNRESKSVSYTVSNEGGNPATGFWIDRLYISADPAAVNLANATLLATVTRPANLAPTETYTNTVNVTLPDGVTGPHYLYVWTDAGNLVYEYTFENNNTRRATGATAIETPDLAVQNTGVPAAALSGDTLTVTWTDRNVGAGKLINRDWTDRVYISQNAAFNPNTATPVGAVGISGTTLNAGAGLARSAQVILPDGIAGQYYWFVYADAGFQIYENNVEANNVDTPGISLTLSLAPYADLTPTAVSGPANAAAGAAVSVTYTVKNQGTGTAVPPWKDKIYLSNSTTWNPNSVQLLHVETVSTSLSKDSSRTSTRQVTLPINLLSGVYYLFVETDPENEVYEYTGEENNRLASGGMNVTGYPPVDLAVTNFTAPPAAPSGTSIPLTWTITNQAVAATIVSSWNDELYLSADSVWQPADLLLAKRAQNGPLPGGAAYTAMQTAALPNGLSGNYYLLLIDDRDNLHNDLDRTNNRTVRLIAITLTPPPDLAPTGLDAPAQGFAGQPIEVAFAVKNLGTGSTAPVTNWTDRFFLSTDFNLDAGDQLLANVAHTGALGVGATYADTAEVFLPAGAAGNKILILKTDVNNSVYEHTAENNNTAALALLIVQPPPSDLVVQQVTVPAMAIAGETVMLQWMLKNQGANPAAGYLREAVYFSLDSLWDTGDALLGVKTGNINLAPQASLAQSFTADLNGVETGQYYAVVRADILNNIAEINEENNTTVSDNPMQVAVNELPLAVLTPDQLDDNRNLYYRIEIPDSLAGESLLVTLKGDSIDGANELYLRYGQTPTRAAYDFAYGMPLFGNQEIVVPALQAGTYYLLAYGNTTAGNQQAITLLANILNFEIRQVAANRGGNTGSITVRIDGAKFEPDMDIRIENQDNILAGSDLLFVNSTRVFVTFHLESGPYEENWQRAGMPPGLYDVVARKQDGLETRLTDGFEVVDGSQPTLNVSLSYPASARSGTVVTMTLDYSNTGTVDVPVPSYSVVSLFDAPIARTPAGLSLNMRDIPVVLTESGGPPGVLRPGATGSITLYTQASGRMRFKLLELE